MEKKLAGRFGEQAAAAYLKKNGYRIIVMNYSCRFGELDLIASRRGYLAFVEVKLRKDDRFATAREFVTAAKQEKIRKTALIWLSQNETALQPRFDVIEVYAPEGRSTGKLEINHIENAFQ